MWASSTTHLDAELDDFSQHVAREKVLLREPALRSRAISAFSHPRVKSFDVCQVVALAGVELHALAVGFFALVLR